MGSNHARVLDNLEGVKLVAVADIKGDTRRVAGLDVGHDVEHLLRAGIDYAVVAVPTGLHLEVGLRLAEAGIATLIEKPLAADLAGAYALRDAYAAAGVIAGVGHIERYNPALQSLRTRLAAGQLGTVYQVVTRRQGPFPARIADVGVVMDLATHDIDLTSWITGQPYEWVAARMITKSGRPHEDMIAVIGQLGDDTITSHLVNWLSPLKERVTVVTGESGAYVADTLTADLTFFANGTAPTAWGNIATFRGVSEGDAIRYAIAKPEPLRTEHEQFRDAQQGKPADVVGLDEGIRIVEVADAVLESGRSGQAVSVKGREQ
jgi:predicted dehydrogenase